MDASNLDEAKAECTKDENCGMFFDSLGKGKYFYYCPVIDTSNYIMVRPSRAGSIAYFKGNLYSLNKRYSNLN